MKLSKIVVAVIMLFCVGTMSNVAFGFGDLVHDESVNVDNGNDVDIDVDPKITNINSDINSNKLDSDISNNANVDINNKDTNINTSINTNKVSNDTDVKQGQLQRQNNKQNISPKQTVTFKTERNRIPSALMRIPGFLSVSHEKVKTWSENTAPIAKKTWTVSELANFATSRFLGFLWPEWKKNIKIEIACWSKAKSVKRVKIVDTENIGDIDISLYELVGRGKGEAVNFFKDTDQVAAGVAHDASKVGVDLIVASKFSTPVATAKTAVVGGGGVTSNGDILNVSGGFGGASSEKLMRARVVADLYRLLPLLETE